MAHPQDTTTEPQFLVTVENCDTESLLEIRPATPPNDGDEFFTDDEDEDDDDEGYSLRNRVLYRRWVQEVEEEETNQPDDIYQ